MCSSLAAQNFWIKKKLIYIYIHTHITQTVIFLLKDNPAAKIDRPLYIFPYI